MKEKQIKNIKLDLRKSSSPLQRRWKKKMRVNIKTNTEGLIKEDLTVNLSCGSLRQEDTMLLISYLMRLVQYIKQWIGNEHFQRMGVQKQITVLMLNTSTKEVFKGLEADGFEGNRPFFDRIDKYRLYLWRIPEFDLTYDLDNTSENEEKQKERI